MPPDAGATSAGGVGNAGAVGSEALTAGNGSSMAGSANAAGAGGAPVAAGAAGVANVAVKVPQCEGDPNVIGPASRPQLTAAAAEQYTIANYLAHTGKLDALTEDAWDPTSGVGDVASFVPTYTVAADGSGTHTKLQAALGAAAASADPSRAFILVRPGTYREVICINGKRPVTIYGKDADATRVQILSGSNAGKTLDADVNPCAERAVNTTTYGIFGSATFAVNSNDVQLKNLTIANDFVEGTDPWAGSQPAVALLTNGDRVALENVRILGNQCTTAFRTPDASTVSRVYVAGSYISGDMQFITGRATVVFDRTEISSRTTRITKPLGSVIASSTAPQNPFGFLIIRSRFTVDLTTDADWVLIGRSWDEGSESYVEGSSPNGQVVIRDSDIARHINKTRPWGNALESARVYDCHGNRLYEYANTGPGAVQ